MRMQSPRSSHWIITLSLAIYRAFLMLGSTEFEEYKEPALQVFYECCSEAYERKGVRGVLALWLPLFYEAVRDMLAERFSSERIQGIHLTLRRSMILTFGAFVLFSLAYLCLLRIIDPLPPFLEVFQHHPGLAWSYKLFHLGAASACLSVICTGMILFVSAIRRALLQNLAATKRQALGLILIPGIFLAGALLLVHLPRAVEIDPRTQLIVVFFGLACLIGEVRLVFRMIREYPFSAEELQFALWPMAITMLAMGISWLATLFWTLRLGIDEPRFAASQGLDFSHFSLNLGGSAGMALVLFLMLMAILLVLAALLQAFRARPLGITG